MPYLADAGPTPSWWCGLTREELQRAIAAHLPQFRQPKKAFYDYVGAMLLQDSWEPRSNPRRRQA